MTIRSKFLWEVLICFSLYSFFLAGISFAQGRHEIQLFDPIEDSWVADDVNETDREGTGEKSVVNIKPVAFWDGSYRNTQFYHNDYNGILFWGEFRLEVEKLPVLEEIDIRPYMRLATTVSDHNSLAWENWGLVGGGIETYPFGSRIAHICSPEIVPKLFGPTRIFAENNWIRYYPECNKWRPNKNARFGIDFWQTYDVYEPNKLIWKELYAGLIYQTANEFDDNYDAWTSSIVQNWEAKYSRKATVCFNHISCWKVFRQRKAIPGKIV